MSKLGVTDEMRDEYRKRLLDVTKDVISFSSLMIYLLIY